MGRYDGHQQGLQAKLLEQADIDSNIRRAAGEVVGISQVFKFGHNGAVGTTEIEVWDVTTAYSYLASAKTLTISSDSAADTAAGSGARTVQITGQGDDGVEIRETLTMNSSIAVSTVNQYRRVYRAQVMTAGASAVNTGRIYIGASTVTNGVPIEKYAAISPEEGQTLMCVYTVPTGKTALLTSLFVAQVGVAGNCTVRLKARPLGGAWNVKDKFVINNNAVQINHDSVPVAFAGGTDISITAEAAASTVPITGTFGIILKDV
jgi:hypothetical protein